jgi:hypothetical protein
MGTLTAQILVGEPHPFHHGINPTHYVFLSENDRPAWVLVGQNIFKESGEGVRKITWIPTVEHMLEDALLMIAVHVCKNKQLIDLAKSFSPKVESDRMELYSDLKGTHRKQLYRKCREVSHFPKVIITIFRGSTIEKQLRVLGEYKMEVEVCVPIFSRLYSCWENELKIEGSLE